ncbi:hypothetical protein M3Y96_00549600 [Aphelenchoides besseyi]|nr:hypothetical protein M3Y96_00549600 [Aphelenchoides besseyi]
MLWLLICYVNLSQTSIREIGKSISFELYFVSFVFLNPGTPTQYSFYGILNLYIGELLLVDINCGERLFDCPRYCQDPNFFVTYCPLGCDANLNPITRKLYCNNFASDKYKSNESLTFEIIKSLGKWSYQLNEYRKLEGIWVKDVFKDQYSKNIGTLRFVDLLYSDARLAGGYNALLGLAPNENGFVHQLFEQNLIDRVAVTFVPTFPRGRFIAGERANRSYCREDQWTTHSTIHPHFWFLRAEEIQIGDQIYFNQTITFGFDAKLRIPANHLDPLLRKRILFQRAYNDQLEASINSERLNFKLRIGRRAIRCPTHFWSTSAARYTNTAGGWSFGISDRVCLFFDYETMNVGLGTLIRR